MSEPIPTYGLTNAALTVRDVDEAFRFYSAIFGMVAVYRGADFLQAQTPGSRDVLVFERATEGVGRRGGILHFGFRIRDPADIERAAETIVAAGGTIRESGEFVPGEPYIFFTDPDGYEFELWYELPTAIDPP